MSDNEKEVVLVVMSKVKAYIKDKAGLMTSSAVADALTVKVKDLCDKAIASAQADKRKTVMDRDFTTAA